ncbi:hypothetical protein ACHAXS_001566 [Conticribra weissflogii]
MNIWPNLECGSGGGGHVVLGRNGAGKTLLSRALVHAADSKGDHDDHRNPYLQGGHLLQSAAPSTSSSPPRNRTHRFLSLVSFESHSDLLRHDGLTVHRALIPTGGNRLSPTAKFLSVRLGMFPLLPRRVASLSTGQIRRVLLVRALVSRPSLLVLDNALDGLDDEGIRGAEDVADRVLRGFRMDILVEGVGNGRDDVGRTQILLLAHRPEEVLEGVGRVSFARDATATATATATVTATDRHRDRDRERDVRIQTMSRCGRSGRELVDALKYWNDGDWNDDDLERAVAGGSSVGIGDGGTTNDSRRRPWELVSDESLPDEADVRDVWYRGRNASRDRDDDDDDDNHDDEGVVVRADDLRVTRDDAVLLSDLSWTVRRGERWHLAGTNGTGKSTLSRLIVRWSVFGAGENGGATEGVRFHGDERDSVVAGGSLFVTSAAAAAAAGTSASRRGAGRQRRRSRRRGGVGWVSTELHLHAVHHWGERTVLDILTSGILPQNDRDTDYGAEEVDTDTAIAAATWLGLLDHSTSTSTSTSSGIDRNKHPFLKRTFHTLSQGQQKLLLIASAIARRPSLLVLDEPCQGLDLWNRGHVLGLIERICNATDMSLVYVTHHNEELIPAITMRLSLEDGRSVYCGPMMAA